MPSSCSDGSARPTSTSGPRRPNGSPAKQFRRSSTPAANDKRFNDPEWSPNQFFDFLKQAYLLTDAWADKLVRDAADLDPHTRQKAEFYVRQIANALSPSNFVLTNPELLRETLTSNADNLVRGMRMLAEDIEAGGGELKIRQSDASMFEVGRNLATTPGKVIFQNELMQLIQYAPSTAKVLKRPLLIVPPWINKFYVLDLTPEKSFIKWCVDQGLTVFCMSWVNPDARLAQKTFDDYMREGPSRRSTPSSRRPARTRSMPSATASAARCSRSTLAAMAAKGDDRIVSATLFAAQVDFTYAGDLKVFVDEEQVAAHRAAHGRARLSRRQVDGHRVQFAALERSDLALRHQQLPQGQGAVPVRPVVLEFRRHAAAGGQSFVLHAQLLSREQDDQGPDADRRQPIDLKSITIPVYNLATREDHIAPAKSVLFGSKFFGGRVRFVLSGSGHIAGVVNPPAKNKYQYWTGAKPRSANLDGWIARAKEHPGSWWPDWLSLAEKAGQDGSAGPRTRATARSRRSRMRRGAT